MAKKSLALSLFLLLLGAPAQAKVTLREAVSRARARSAELADGRLNAEASTVRKSALEARRAFTLTVSGSLGVASDSPHVTAGDMPWVVERLDESLSPEFHLFSSPRVAADLHLGLSQPLFTGGALRRGAEAEAFGMEAEAEMARVRETKIEAEVEASYFRSRAVGARLESLRLLVESLAAHLQKVERLLGEELARPSDVLETRMKIEEVRLAALDAELAAAEERAVFNGLCGLDPSEIEDPPRTETPALDDAIAAFRSAHPFFRYLGRKIDQAEAAGRVSAAESGFQMSGFAQAHVGSPGIRLFDPRPQFYVLGGLNVDLPLLDSKKRSTDAALTEIELRKLDVRRDEFAREGETELRRAYDVKAALEAKAETARRLLALAGEDLRLKTRLYEEGQIPNLDCLAAVSRQESSRAAALELEWRIEAAKAAIRVWIGPRSEEP